MWLFGFLRPAPAISDHDRLILLEQKVDLTSIEIRRIVDAALREVETQDERLVQGNRRFNDLDLYQQRTDEALADVRNTSSAARLTSDNAIRGLEGLARTVDQHSGTLEKRIAQQREELEEQIEKAIEDALAPLRKDIGAIKDTVTRWTVQGSTLRVVTGPAVSIALAIATTFFLRWLFP